ncbi:MAG: hypothetical protein IIZ08_07855 [Clostridia bacterium]|jgi:predicted transposase/invertase (TIGR01784 family)|nr:hypothetical protein [Clostridia bacterium]
MDYRERFREKDLERIRRLRLIDDDFFRVCFKDDKEGAEFILRIILDKDDLKILTMRTQYSVKNLQGHSVILDVFATDSDQICYNIEIQRADSGAIPKRARYISSVIDANLLHSADDYAVLPRSYVIFITENDVIGEGRLIYHIDRVITESGNVFDDGSHIIYVNASYRDESALGKLMHDFTCAEPKKMYYAPLKERAKQFKDENKEEGKMCEIWEEVRKEGYDLAMEVAAKEIAAATEAKEKAAAEAAEAKEKAAAEAAEAKEKAAAEAAEAREKAAAEVSEAKKKAAAEAAEAAEAKEKAAAEIAEAKVKAAEAEMKAKMRDHATKTAISMIKRGNLTTEEISEYTGLTEDEVREYAELIAG